MRKDMDRWRTHQSLPAAYVFRGLRYAAHGATLEPVIREQRSARQPPPGAVAGGPSRHRGRSRRGRIVVIALLALLMGGGIYGGLLARAVWQDALQGRAAFNQGLAALDLAHVERLTA